MNVRQFVWGVVYLVLFAAAGRAADEPLDAGPADATAVENVAPDDEVDERRQKALIGLAGVAAIAIIGVTLGAVIILWAGRLRRLNRKPLPDASLKDELWFLKPPKTTPGDSPAQSPTPGEPRR